MPNKNKDITWVVFNAAFIMFMVKLDAFVVNVSLPTIARAFGINVALASFVIVSYLLMLTNTMLIFGKLEDRLGIKKMLLAGYLIFTAGSFFCGLAPDIFSLIFARALQGCGGAMLLICAFGSINTFLPDNIKGWGMGLVTAAAAVGIATGAPLGGAISYLLNWRWIFFINVPLGLLGFLASAKILPAEAPAANRPAPFDWPGAILSFIGLTSITCLLSIGNDWGWRAAPTLSLAAVTLITLSGFAFWETHHANPLLEFKIFKNRGFALGNLAVFLVFMILAGADFIVPFFLEIAKGLNPLQVGFFLLLYSAAYSLTAPFAGKLCDQPKLRLVSQAATLLCAALFIIFGLTYQIPCLMYTLGFFTLWGMANAFPVTENFRLVLAHTPAGQKGIGAGIFNIANNLSMACGVCSFQIIYSLSSAFRPIFIFAGILYLLAFFASEAAEKAKGK